VRDRIAVRGSPILLLAVTIFTVILAGCGGRRPATATVPAAPPSANAPTPIPATPEIGQPPAGPSAGIGPSLGGYTEQGMASWYGLPFHGRKAANGEIFDMNELVAAHRTLTFGSIVRVTNMNNGLSVDVRIIDRGPFVAGRIIDLSQAAAKAIQMIGTGIAPVRIEVVTAAGSLNNVFSVQVGAFQKRENAERLRTLFMARYPVYVQEFDTAAGHFYRVRIGRLATQQDALQLAGQLANENSLNTFVVRLDGIQ
jgi:rare lipoprotein A